MRKLSTADIEQMASLYRAASSDLALAKRDFPTHPITRALNQLVARTHALMYQGEALAWNPPRAGRYVVRVVDEAGRADSRDVSVEVVP